MKILLLGRNGQLGRALTPMLSRFGDVATLGRDELDLVDAKATKKVVLAVQPDLVVNAAAYTAVDRAEEEPELAMLVNGRAPGSLARAVGEVGGAMIHFSTDYVFDGEREGRYNEDDKVNPINEYGRSKRAGEEAVIASGAPHLILRTTWLYSAWGQNFFTTMLRLGAERREIAVVDDQSGAPTSVGVIAAAMEKILQQTEDNPGDFFQQHGGIVHVACQGETSWHGFANAIFNLARQRKMTLKIKTVRPISSAEFGAPARRPANSRLDLARLEERFGIATPDWREALANVFADIPH